MTKLQINGRTVTIDTKKLSKGLCDLHNECENKKTMLAFGMLDAKLIELFEQSFAKSVKAEFSDFTNDLFKDKIKNFIKDTSNEITKGIYQYATMVV